MMSKSILLVLLGMHLTSAYQGVLPPDRRALAGIWKLTPRSAHALKEFTTYPKKLSSNDPKLLLLLKEDGSFQQYSSDDEEDNANLDESWESFQASRKRPLTAVQDGVWDLVDGKLVLAANRLDKERIYDIDSKLPDTLLEGQVVMNDLSSTRLSVPLGSIKIGRFFYPQSHPSFFEQPMFRPRDHGAFQLSQVLGSYGDPENPQSKLLDDDEDLYYRDDLYNKTFLLTAHPIVPKTPKGKKRWSIKYNKFVFDGPKKEAKEAAEQAAQATPLVAKVTRIRFHPNGTFSTIPEESDWQVNNNNPTILRGKWDVMGPQNSQLWFQVWRFGFGRSVSGSTYSQGRMLTQDDAKMYWGTIGSYNSTEENDSPRMEVRGSVLFGSGLEPLPVGHFIMREIDENWRITSLLDDDDDEEDDDEEINERCGDDDGVDWSSSGGGFE